jgi:hypothetical protein
MVTVHCVAAATVVPIEPPVVGLKVIETRIANPLEVDGRTLRATFGRVIENHV